MSTPNALAGNSDAPVAAVSFGPSEIAGYLIAFSTLITSIVGKDWGIGANAQALGLLASGLVALGISISRAVKHQGAMHANAAVYVAQLVAAGTVASTPGVSLASVASAANALSDAVSSDFNSPASSGSPLPADVAVATAPAAPIAPELTTSVDPSKLPPEGTGPGV